MGVMIRFRLGFVMAITMSESGAVALEIEGGLCFRFTLREADPEEDGDDVRQVPPDPTGQPIISARFRYESDSGPIGEDHLVFRPHEFTDRARFALHFHLGDGLSPRALESTINLFFSSGDSVRRLRDFDSRPNSVGYFCLDLAREGWLGSPSFRAVSVSPEAMREAREAYYGPARGRFGFDMFRWTLTAQCFNDTDCAICLDRLIEGDRVAQLSCCHCFHTYCLVRWLRITNVCPMCRFLVT